MWKFRLEGPVEHTDHAEESTRDGGSGDGAKNDQPEKTACVSSGIPSEKRVDRFNPSHDEWSRHENRAFDLLAPLL